MKFSLNEFPELLVPNLKIKNVKNIIKDKTGIKEENQSFTIYSDLHDTELSDLNDENFIWDYFHIYICDISNYNTKISTNYYTRDIILDLNKNIEELKKMVFEQTKIPIDRLKFYLKKKN